MVTVAAPTRIDRLVDMLELLSIQIDTMLDEIAGTSLLEARRLITRDLHYEPRAEELQIIVGMAAEEAAEGPRRELPRKLLRLRLLADRQLKHVLETRTLHVGTMRTSGETLGDIVGATLRLERELDRVVTTDESLNQNDRDYLLRVGNVLSCQQDELVAGSILALRLAELAESMAQGNLDDMEPSLTAKEREHLEAFAAENITQESCRTTIDAIAIRSSLERLFTAWRELGKPSEDSDALRAQRERVLGRLRQNMIALESVSTRLQTQRDAALVANIESLAVELQEAGRGLFSIKLQLAPVLRDPYIDVEFSDHDREAPQDLRERLAASAAEEAEAEAGPRETSKEELYVGALKEMQGRKEAQIEELRKQRKQTALERQRQRMKWMVAASIVLAIMSAIVNFVILPRTGSTPSAPEMAGLPPTLDVRGSDAAGPVMITRVDGWNDLGEASRQTSVDRMGEIGSENGIGMIVVVDEYGQAAAAWDERAGTTLVRDP